MQATVMQPPPIVPPFDHGDLPARQSRLHRQRLTALALTDDRKFKSFG
jgi:hypothetical protein